MMLDQATGICFSKVSGYHVPECGQGQVRSNFWRRVRKSLLGRTQFQTDLIEAFPLKLELVAFRAAVITRRVKFRALLFPSSTAFRKPMTFTPPAFR
jgi:hypothetical protein